MIQQTDSDQQKRLCLKAKWKFLKFETALKYIDVCFDPSIPGTGNSGLTKKRIRTGDVPPSLIHRYAKPQRFATATTSKIPWGENNCCHGAFEDEIFTQWKVLQWCKSGFFLTTFHSLIHLSLLDSQAIFYQDLPAIYSCKCSKMITLAS